MTGNGGSFTLSGEARVTTTTIQSGAIAGAYLAAGTDHVFMGRTDFYSRRLPYGLDSGDTIANANGDTAVVKFAEPDDGGFIVVNWDKNPCSATVWEFAYQDGWTKVRQYPERWLVFAHVVVAFTSLEGARDYAAADDPGILHVRKDGTTEWIDVEEEG